MDKVQKGDGEMGWLADEMMKGESKDFSGCLVSQSTSQDV